MRWKSQEMLCASDLLKGADPSWWCSAEPTLGQDGCEGLFLCKDTAGRRWIALIEPCTRFYAFRLKERHGEAMISHVFPDTGR